MTLESEALEKKLVLAIWAAWNCARDCLAAIGTSYVR
jgi:hypothetical protein